MNRKLLLFAAVAAVCVPMCRAADNPWDGTWKLNQAKSKLTGDTFTLTALPNGGFHLSTPSHSLDRDYTCDGKDYVVFADVTGTCKRIDDTHYEMAGKIKGQPNWHGTSVVSGGGKYLTNKAHEHRPDGTETDNTATYERVGTGTGRAGTWRNVKMTESLPDFMKITLRGDIMRCEIPAYKMIMTAKLDGSVAKLEGPTATPDFTIRVKADSPTRLHYVQALNGKPSSEGMQTVSADGKTLIEEEWESGVPNEKQTYVYDKQ